MSATIDNRVVEMHFDNEDFEKNAEQSIKTTDKLKESLNNLAATTGLQKLTETLDFNPIERGITAVSDKMDLLGYMGQSAMWRISNAILDVGTNLLTAIPNQIKSGGWARAMNVEDAKFRLQGLGIAWSEVADDIDHAVLGTAYGADEASKAASMLAASGVKYGGVIETLADGTQVYSEMGRSLRAISGVAAMTNSSYSEMADIFTSVAGSGKLMGQNIQSFSVRGLNVLAEMGKQVGKTEAEMKDMMSKGQISFQMFADAMDKAFGEHATKANETLQGSMSNMRAALSRMGQDYAAIIMTETPRVFNAIKGFFNQIRTYTKPIAENIFGPIFTDNMKTIAAVIDKITASLPKITAGTKEYSAFNRVLSTVRSTMQGLENIFYSILIAFIPAGEAFKQVFGEGFVSNTLTNLSLIAMKFRDFTALLVLHGETAEKVMRIFKGVFSVFDILGKIISAIIKLMEPLAPIFSSFIDLILDVGVAISDAIVAFDQWLDKTDFLSKAVNKLKEGFAPVLQFISGMVKGIQDTLAEAAGAAKLPMITLPEALGNIFQVLKDRAQAAMGILQRLTPMLYSLGGMIKNMITGTLTALMDTVSRMFSTGGINTLFNSLSLLSFTSLEFSINHIADTFRNFATAVKAPFTRINALLADVKNTLLVYQSDLKADILKKIAIAIGILAASIWVLSSADPDGLRNAVFALAGIATVLVAAMAAIMTLVQGSAITVAGKGLAKIGSFFTSLTKNLLAMGEITFIAAAMKSVALALLILTASLLLMADIPFEKLLKGVVVIGLMSAILAVTMAYLSSEAKSVLGLSVAVVAFSAGILILVNAVEKMSKIMSPTLVASIMGVSLLMFALAASMKLMTTGTNVTVLVGVATTIIAMAGAMVILTTAVEKLAVIPMNQLIQGCLAAIVLLAALAGAAVLISKFAPLVSVAALGLIALAGALYIVAVVVEKFATLAADQNKSLSKGLIATIVALAALSAVAAVMSTVAPAVLVASAAMLIMAVALTVLTAPIILMSTLKIPDIIKGILALAAAMVVFGFVGSYLGIVGPLLASAAAGLSVLAQAMMQLIPVVALMAALDMATIATALRNIHKGLRGIAKTAVLISLISPMLISSAAALAMFSLGLAAMGKSFTAAAEGINALANISADSILKIIANIGLAITSFCQMLLAQAPVIIAVIIRFFTMTLDVIIGIAPKIGETIVTVLLTVFESLQTLYPKFVEMGIVFLRALFQALVVASTEFADLFCQAFVGLVGEIIDGIINLISEVGNRIPELISSIVGLITNFLTSIAMIIPEAITQLMANVTAAFYKFALELRVYTPLLMDAAAEFVRSLFYAIGQALVDAPQLGKMMVLGFAEGIGCSPEAINEIETMLDTIISIMQGIARDVIEAGLNFVLGFAVGIAEGVQDVYDTVKDMVTGAISQIAIWQDSHSPSKKSASKGHDLADGYAKGINENSDKAADEAAKMAQGAVDAVDAVYGPAMQNAVYDKNAVRTEEYIRKNSAAYEAQLRATGQAVQKSSTIAKKEESAWSKLGNAMKDPIGSAKRTFKEALGINLDLGKSTENTTDSIEEQAKAATENSNALNTMGGSAKGAGGAAKEAKNEIQEFTDSIQKNLESQTGGMKFFDKLELKTELTADSILENMKSNLDGISSWSSDLGKLMEKGLDQGLIKTLADAGIDSYEQVHAFLGMSDEQIQQANEMFAKSNEARTSAATDLTDKYYAIGVNNMEGLANGIEKGSAEAEKAATENAKKTLAASEDTFETHSPSSKFDQIGQWNMEGLYNGMETGAENVYTLCQTICDKIVEVFEFNTQSETFMSIGANFTLGLADGILSEKAIGKLKAAVDEVTEMIEVDSKKDLKEKSPSRIAYQIGQYWDLGLANGILDGEMDVKKASINLTRTTVSAIQNAQKAIDDTLNEGLEYNPVIKPLLDTSDLLSEANGINSLFANERAALNANMMADWSNPAVRSKFLTDLTDAVDMDKVVQAINGKDTNAKVYLEGDAGGVFKIVQRENRRFIKRTGYNGLT